MNNNNNLLDTALTDIDGCIRNYKRGLFTALEVSEGIWDVLLDISLANATQLYQEIIPLCAEYIILDKYAVSQLRNVISDWKINWRIGIYRFVEDIYKKTSVSDEEKKAYYRAYTVLNVCPEYDDQNAI